MAGNVLEFNDANWKSEVLESEKPVVVDFWAPWCGPCRMLAPTISKLADEFAGKVKVGKMDTDQNSDTPPSLRISGIPAVVFFQGGKEVDRIVGLQPEKKYKDALERLGVTV
jgi:thioredoxin 1